jgi:hypothetical protein
MNDKTREKFEEWFIDEAKFHLHRGGEAQGFQLDGDGDYGNSFVMLSFMAYQAATVAAEKRSAKLENTQRQLISELNELVDGIILYGEEVSRQNVINALQAILERNITNAEEKS